ncbi:MAG TPA: hypothetical protein VMZ69_07810, partial [Saprospiraceae bacterium]|nr:hypothetical protein [Saprospiraceae bacterium]
MAILQPILKFIHHRLKAKKWDSFHSPHLFQLFTYACDDSIQFPLFNTIEKERELMLKSNEKINRLDFGAGSYDKTNLSSTNLNSVAATALSRPFQCRFMSRLANLSKANTIIEFGTSLGISAAYLSTGSPSGKIIT